MATSSSRGGKYGMRTWQQQIILWLRAGTDRIRSLRQRTGAPWPKWRRLSGRRRQLWGELLLRPDTDLSAGWPALRSHVDAPQYGRRKKNGLAGAARWRVSSCDKRDTGCRTLVARLSHALCRGGPGRMRARFRRPFAYLSTRFADSADWKARLAGSVYWPPKPRPSRPSAMGLNSFSKAAKTSSRSQPPSRTSSLTRVGLL